MSIIDFFSQFPTEQKCKDHFKEYRIKEGITCKKCGKKEYRWLPKKEQFECKDTACRFRTTLKSGTMMEGSKLPFKYWFIAMWYLSTSKKTLSALEMQRQIGHKYEVDPKLRTAFG